MVQSVSFDAPCCSQFWCPFWKLSASQTWLPWPPWAVRAAHVRDRRYGMLQIRSGECCSPAIAFEGLYTYNELDRNYIHFSIVVRNKFESNLLTRPDNRKLFRMPNVQIIQDPRRMCEVFSTSFPKLLSTQPQSNHLEEVRQNWIFPGWVSRVFSQLFVPVSVWVQMPFTLLCWGYTVSYWFAAELERQNVAKYALCA